MKHLLLLRHALTQNPTANGRDQDRPLTNEGRHQALSQGRCLRNKYEVDFIGCSTAVRTRQTLEHLKLPEQIKCQFVENLYLPSTQDIEDFIAYEIPQKAETALIVTHFPGVLDFAVKYGADCSYYPEAALSVYSASKWDAFKPGAVNFQKFYLPDAAQ